ncbi:MAG: autoinducer binding domain-containing protein [Betaproteobacteria bacterium]|nr:autoinducer binding domain-containing protein [Betaproteobacteria bacterium]
MKEWQEHQLHALQTITCDAQLFKVVVSIAHSLGFDHCSYGLRMPLPVSRPKVVLLTNYPHAWEDRYKEKGYLSTDPTVRHGAHSLQPVVWSDALFASSRDLWEEARAFGLCVGWAQSSRDVNSTMGMLSVSRSGEPISEVELRDKEVKLAWLTQMAHLGMSRILTAKLMPEAKAQLTDREIEVLRWTADGKTASEIADILNISERTANFHVANAITKLHAPNKTAAVIRAGMLGMLG